MKRLVLLALIFFAALSHAAEEINTSSFCDRVQTTEVYKKYAKLTGDAIRGGYYSPFVESYTENNHFYRVSHGDVNSVPRPLFNSSDRLLWEWMYLQKNYLNFDDTKHEGFVARGSKKSIFSGNPYLKEGERVESVVAACFDQLLPTDFAYIFLPRGFVDQLRRQSAELGKRIPVKKVREVTAKGEIIERIVSEPTAEDENNYAKQRNRLLFYYSNAATNFPGNSSYPDIDNDTKTYRPNFPHWVALLYGGEKVLEVSGSEFLKGYEVHLTANRRAMTAEKSKSIEHVQIIAAIKNGDYRKAKSCAEISEALAIGTSYFQTAITPPKKSFAGTGSLAKHADNALGGSEELLARGDGRSRNYAKLSIPKNALVIGAKDAVIGGPVSFIGIYSSNSSVMLTSGASVQIPVFNATCVHYGVMSFLF